MNEHIMVVPASQDAGDWFRFINFSISNLDSFDNLKVDFNEVKFLDTDDFVVLACLIECYFELDCSISFTGGSNGFNDHLYNIKFKEYWKPGFDRCRFTLGKNKTTFCLWKISKELIDSYSQYAKSYIESLVKDKDLVAFASNLNEVFNNIFDHAESHISGYIITQYYPLSKKISFSVCDFGIGIPTSINNNLIEKSKPVVEDWKALVLSLELGYSTNSTPRNRGFGLNNILSYSESTNGFLSIISNNGLLTKRAGEMYSLGNSNYNFNGTLIKLEIDLDALESKDSSNELFDFYG